MSAAKPNEAFRLSGFRTAYVFDVEQTEGRPLPEFARTAGDPKDFGDKLKAIVARQGIALEYDAGIAPAYGVSTGGRIRLLPSLSAAEEFGPDLILLDVMMPGVDGGELAARFKASAKLKTVPTVFLTAAVTKEEVSAGGGLIGGV